METLKASVQKLNTNNALFETLDTLKHHNRWTLPFSEGSYVVTYTRIPLQKLNFVYRLNAFRIKDQVTVFDVTLSN